MEPYNPEKSWLEFKFNKEQAKEQLKQTIPGLRALMYMHDNPESSALETLDLAAEDFVPFYSAIKYGADPSDFAKEAMLLGLIRHVGGPSKSELINEIKNNPNREWYNSNQDLFYKDNKGNLVNYDSPDYTPDMNNIRKYNSYQDVLDDINNTQDAVLTSKSIIDKWYKLQDANAVIDNIDDFTSQHPYINAEYGGYGRVLSYNKLKDNYDEYVNTSGGWKLNGTLSKERVNELYKDGYIGKDSQELRVQTNKANKDLKHDIQMFNLDDRWWLDPEFKHMSYDNPRDWQYME